MKPKTITAIILALVLCVGLLPTAAAAADGIRYIDASGNEASQDDVTEISSETVTWTDGWYVVNGTVTIGQRVTVNDNVHIILADGCNLTVNGGIRVTGSNSLTIYAQSTGDSMGSLTAQNVGNYSAGIGNNQGESRGTVNIYGGVVTATGGWGGAGIGGSSSGHGGTVIMTGGTVTANGQNHGAGIGGGMNGEGGTVTITGGIVTANGNLGGAGIGGGMNGEGGIVNITGGMVIATGGNNGGSGIGGGFRGVGGTVTVTGGMVIARSAWGGSGIGHGNWASGNTVFSTGDNGTAVIFAGSISDNDDPSGWSGVIFQGNVGQVYGNQTLTENLTVEEGQTLAIPEDITLTVQEGVTLTNNGTISGAGILDMDGAMSGTGTVTCIVLAGSGTSEETAFQIPNLATLEYYRDKINNGESNYPSAYYEVTKNIDMSTDYGADVNGGTSWTPIGTVSTPFTGTFDGGNCEISGLYVNRTSDEQGLFLSLAKGGTIKNLRLSGTVTGGSYVGGLAGRNHGTIENCQSAVSVSGTVQAIGGLVGFNNGTISNSENSGTVKGMMSVGGVAGYNSNNCEMNGCVNTGSITGTVMYTGGVVGMNNGGIISGCENSGTIYGEAYTGGVAGHMVSVTAGAEADAVIENCNNTGTVSGTNVIGGIVGAIGNADSVVSGCHNSGAISSTAEDSAAGGIAGYNHGTLTNCYCESVNGSVISSAANGAKVGGLAGGNTGSLTNSYNMGEVSATGDNATAGGVAGINYTNITVGNISNCYSIGTVSGNGDGTSADGVAGSNDTGNGAAISNSYYLSDSETETINGVTGKTQAQFASGEVAYLLQGTQSDQVWGQAIGTDNSPVLTSESVSKVYKAIFMEDDETEYAAMFGNSGAAISTPTDTPTRDGYTFSGWAGYTEGMTLTEDMVFEATWESTDAPPTTQTYPPVIEDNENGRVNVSPRNPERGEEVTVTPRPDQGYEVDEITVTDRNGNEVEITDNGDGTYSFEQPRGRVTIEVTFKPAACDGGADCPSAHLSDIAVDAWYHAAVDYVVANGLMEGTSATAFSPDEPFTRGMLATILWRLEESPVVNYQLSFNDVAEGQWYTEAVRWAASEEIVGGYGDGSFRPEDAVSREEMAAIFYRYAQHKGYDVSVGEDTNILSYADAAMISEYAIPAMQWACGAGVLEGNGQLLTPQADTPRCQAAAVLMRFCEGVAQ